MKGIYPFIAFFFFACSPKVLVQQTDTVLAPLLAYAPFAVFELDDEFTAIEPQLLGNVTIKDGGLALNCDFKTVVALASKKARGMGGNCLKITEHKPPKRNTCHQIKAEIYRIANATDYEEEIIWHTKRKLAIRDFKGSTEKQPFQAATVSSFEYFTERNPVNDKVLVKARSLFYCPMSYFKPSESDALILAHEQLHFDITELFARKFISKIAESVSNYQNLLDKHEDIAKEIFEALQLKQEEYDTEVYADFSTQAKWNTWVEEQLELLAKYKEKTVTLSN